MEFNIRNFFTGGKYSSPPISEFYLMGWLVEEKKHLLFLPYYMYHCYLLSFHFPKLTGEQLPCYTKDWNKMSLWKARNDGSYIITYHICNDSYYNFISILLLFQWKLLVFAFGSKFIYKVASFILWRLEKEDNMAERRSKFTVPIQ